MTRRPTVGLLRLMYKHLDLPSLLKEDPSIGKSDVDELFREFADFLTSRADDEPAPAGGPHRQVIVYSDGASRGNPGEAGVGVVITDARGRVIMEEGRPLGRQTNNFAEYAAAIRGLEDALRLGAKQVTLRADSELLIKQLSGEYRVRNAALQPLHAELIGLARRFVSFKAEHVPREMNARADDLAGRAARGGL